MGGARKRQPTEVRSVRSSDHSSESGELRNGNKNEKKKAKKSHTNMQQVENKMDTSEHSAEITGSRKIVNNEHHPSNNITTSSCSKKNNNAQNTAKYNTNNTACNTNQNTDKIIEKENTNMYKSSDKAPFYVMLEKDNIQEIDISRRLLQQNINIFEIRKLNKHKARVECKTFQAANSIVENESLKLQNVKAYVPSHFTRSVGVVRGVPDDWSMEEIWEHFRCDVPVDNIERMNFFDKITKEVRPGTSLKVTFRSTSLPREVKVCYVVRRVDHFIPRPIVCRNCLRYGHTAKYCKAKESLCNNCAEETHNFHNNTCNNSCAHCNNTCSTKCKYCGDNGNHRTTAFVCPKMKEEMKIKEKMVKENLSHIEAKKMLEVTVQNEMSYAKVSYLMEYNNTLMKRLKATESLLKDLFETGNTPIPIIPNSGELFDPRVEDMVKAIHSHFKTFKIAVDDSDSEKSD